MPLHGLPFRLGLEVMSPYLITRDNGGKEIIALSIVTGKHPQADDFSLLLMFFG
jgi:hypothetical protein